MEVLEEFDSEFPHTVTFCQLISVAEFKRQATTYTESALRRLFHTLDRDPVLAERVLRKSKQAECERRGLLSFLWAKFLSAVQGPLNLCNSMGAQEMVQRLKQLKRSILRVHLYARGAKKKRRKFKLKKPEPILLHDRSTSPCLPPTLLPPPPLPSLPPPVTSTTSVAALSPPVYTTPRVFGPFPPLPSKPVRGKVLHPSQSPLCLLGPWPLQTPLQTRCWVAAVGRADERGLSCVKGWGGGGGHGVHLLGLRHARQPWVPWTVSWRSWRTGRTVGLPHLKPHSPLPVGVTPRCPTPAVPTLPVLATSPSPRLDRGFLSQLPATILSLKRQAQKALMYLWNGWQ